MTKFTKVLCTSAIMTSAMMTFSSWAQSGQPHSVKASANFDQVTVEWNAPTSDIELKWHNSYDYNGMDGLRGDPQGASVIYGGSKFLPAELAAVAGEQVEAIAYFQYRDVANIRVQIYENGVLVRDQPVDVNGFTKNTWKKVMLKEPYTISGNDELMFVVRYEHGYNMSMVAITDKVTHKGKGNMVSYDGKKFTATGNGDFLVTAYVKNAATAEPSGYNVYRNGEKVNAELLDATSSVFSNEPEGANKYTVGAVYADGEKQSYFAQAVVAKASNMLAPATNFAGSASELDGELHWQAPLKGGSELTWSDKSYGNKIGGTSTSAPKVWVKQEFDANDLLAFQNYKINAINAFVAEPVTAATLFVIKDGVIDYSEDVASVSELGGEKWSKLALATPYEMSTGHSYAFGVYFTHASGGHPIGVDKATEVDVKGNSFSTSSPSSKGFNQTSPSWKTLASGKIAGNFMLTADVEPIEAATPAAVPTGYDIYRDGEKVASDITATSFSDAVEQPGTYKYTLVTKYDGKQSPALVTNVTYTMPAAYSAPVITESTFDKESGEFNLAWSQDAAELKHYGTAAYTAGFSEEMPLVYGAKFTKDELAAYKGYEIKTVKFAIGAALESFKIEIINGKGVRLASEEISGSDINPVTFYSLTLSTPVEITGEDDLFIAYNATLPANVSALILDEGPAVDGGAMVSLSNGASWLKLGTIATDYAAYNIVIAATALAKDAPANAKGITLGNSMNLNNAEAITINAADVKAGFGIEATVQVAPAKKTAKKAAARPNAVSYNVYCNGAMKSAQQERNYSEVIKVNGEFDYYVTSVYENGWESPASKVIVVNNPITQAAPAPYALKGDYKDNGNLQLTWKAANEAAVLTYQKNDGLDMALGMTGTGVREAYAGARFPTDSLSAYAGKKITHITFKLASVQLKSASVFVMVGEGQDIVFEQPVDVESLQMGCNTVRLNKPFEISGDVAVGFGYHCTYDNGVKPHILDGGPATVPGVSDQISSSAGYGYWYSLKTKYKQDYNWRISATVADADTTISAKKSARVKTAAAVTYNVYCNEELIADNLTTTSYEVAQAANGTYTVTAVTDGVESAVSNAVVLKDAKALVGDVNADGKVDVSDVTALINKILGEADYSDSVCDINADGVVNVSDVTALINIILAQ
ncbi:MAG: dockerin type I domain-containing protein [Muribaculaceae bacterium]|nr:dockerin type I domain-containing protein [Muribaculaceae bacterium]